MFHTPPDRDPELRRAFALDDQDQVAELSRMAGEPATARKPKARVKAKRAARKPRAFEHPADPPSADEMLSALSRYKSGAGFGFHRFYSGRKVAADLECQIYNAWVIMQCWEQKLLEPGELTAEQFKRRYWDCDDEGGA